MFLVASAWSAKPFRIASIAVSMRPFTALTASIVCWKASDNCWFCSCSMRSSAAICRCSLFCAAAGDAAGSSISSASVQIVYFFMAGAILT